jgi:hypothetical protein
VEGFMEVVHKMEFVTTMNLSKLSPTGGVGGGL